MIKQIGSRFFMGIGKKDLGICLFISVLVCLLGITGESLWIDEGTTAWLASHPTFSDLIKTQLTLSGSESQMPFYVWYAWAWARFFGINELSLRLSNLPFLILFLLSIQWGSRVLFQNNWAWTLSAAAPFVWFYLNEARPYLGVIAFSSIATVEYLVYLTQRDKSRVTPWGCLIGIFFASGFCLLSAVLIPAMLITLSFKYKIDMHRWKAFLENWAKPILISLPFFVALGGWFAWTLWQGYGGMRETPGISNLLFCIYEFLGFSGLGPPRNLIRSSTEWPSLSRPFLLPLAFGVIGWIGVFSFAVVRMYREGITEILGILSLFLSIGITIFFLSAYNFHFRFWGRHLAQFIPAFLLLLVALVMNTRRRLITQYSQVTICMLMILWLASSLRLAFLADYRKDDYREAVKCAVTAAGPQGTILWAANPLTGSYYGLLFSNPYCKGVYWPTKYPAIEAINWTDRQVGSALQSAHPPIIIAVSKRDLFDHHDSLSQALSQRRTQLIASLSAFSIYKVL
jgi:hypothetical protein